MIEISTFDGASTIFLKGRKENISKVKRNSFEMNDLYI